MGDPLLLGPHSEACPLGHRVTHVETIMKFYGSDHRGIATWYSDAKSEDCMPFSKQTTNDEPVVAVTSEAVGDMTVEDWTDEDDSDVECEFSTETFVEPPCRSAVFAGG
jgi:hypothetical protein